MMKEKNDSNKEKESPEKEEELEKKKERVDRKDIQGSRPAVPFPQRLQKSKIEEQFARFLKTFQKLEISMPFTEVVTQMPLYAKFLKDILSKKRDSRRRDCESHCYLQCIDEERITRKDEGSRELYNSLHHRRS